MKQRNLAIDIFRGLTMALMVFVNDLWTVHDVPQWLKHTATMTDGMGLSDVVFPMFLFAMGMSIPYAIERRRVKGASDMECLKHILGRGLALLLMGAFIVNSERGVSWNKGLYWLIMLTGFFLVWNRWEGKGEKLKKTLRRIGVAVLAGLALAYRSPEGEFFRAGWWGILGLIGWAYMFGASAYLLCGERKWVLPLLWLAFCLINLSVVPMRDKSLLVGPNFLADFARSLNQGNGSCIIMCLGGAITTLCDNRLQRHRIIAGVGAAAVLGLLGLAAHQGWIISKNIGTLPWCLIAGAISVALYTLLRVLEKAKLTGWSKVLGPAGTATLTVYMMPYFFYAFWVFFNPQMPEWMCGWAGVLKCVIFSFLCIWSAALLGKLGLKLKI